MDGSRIHQLAVRCKTCFVVWVLMGGMTVMIGNPATPSRDYPMMRFVSARGRADRPTLECAEFFFGEEKW